MSELILKREVYEIVGAAIDVYNELGSGFLESIYQEAMELELTSRQIEFQRQVPLRVKSKSAVLKKAFFADLICHGEILIELKAVAQTTPADEAQVLNYLKATGVRVGLLINFGDPAELQRRRYVN